VERGETEGKTLLDAMRDGDTDGMQCFDIEIEKLIRAGVIDIEVGLSYATNVGNLRLQLVDLLDPQGGTPEVLKRKDIPQRPQKKVETTPASVYE
jgi:twitching motility protein PilT